MHFLRNLLLTLFLTLPVGAQASVIAVPHSLTVGEGFVNPLGFHDPAPLFSWKLPEGVKRQTAYQVIAKSGKGDWDSGWIESDRSTFIPYCGPALGSRDRVEWRVRFRDESGQESEWSQPALLEIGLLSAEEWKAQWIRPQVHAPETVTGFKVVKAIYRSKEHPELSRDVTSLLSGKIRNESLTVQVDNEELGGDPAPNEAKQLVVTYQAAGKEYAVTLKEKVREILPHAAMPERVASLRRVFAVEKNIRQARLYVTARGLFKLFLNGRRVGNDHFANGWTSYRKRLDTLTYDVTDLLHPGENFLQALLGTGWYAGRLTWEKGLKGLYGEKPQLLLQLEITRENGTRELIVSDGKWEGTFEGPLLDASLYDGENVDARRTESGWRPVVSDPDLGMALLVPKPFPPVRAIERLATREITEPEPGRFVFDLGQNMVGWAKLRIPVKRGRKVLVRFAEMLKQDGTLYTENYRSARSADSYTPAVSGVAKWEPHFTVHGFRYVELSGLPDGIRPSPDWVTGVVLRSDLGQAGTFSSSHEKLNRLQSNIAWGWRGNSVDIPTDCPQRDERLGWTGDAQVFCSTSMFNSDAHAFWKSWLGSMRDDHMPDGSIPHVIPDVLAKTKGDSPGWMDAATIIPWEVYVRTGDEGMLSRNYAMMENLVGWYRSQSTNGLTPDIKGFGDWLQPYAKGQKGETPLPLIGAAYYARSTRILSDSARVLHRDADAARYSAEADFVKRAFAARYLDAGGKLQNAPETQTAYVLALAFDLVPKDLKQKAAANLACLVREAGGHLRTGFLGTPHIARVLDEGGYPDLAGELLFQETYPSWFYPINQGATTIWERWNSYSRDKGFGNAEMNSFNHYAYGAIGQWMYERVAGLAPDPVHPGYKHFLIRPLILNQLDWANAELRTPYGTASSAWKRLDGKVVMDVVVPPNTTATIEFPDGRKPVNVEAGRHHFESGLK
jgi:alpha-L-rhamnosidase